jgi:hypothetical protein
LLSLILWREDYEHTLKIAAKHDITGIRVYDVREQKMPDIGMVSMLDAETAQLINTGSKQFDSITRNIIMSD